MRKRKKNCTNCAFSEDYYKETEQGIFIDFLCRIDGHSVANYSVLMKGCKHWKKEGGKRE